MGFYRQLDLFVTTVGSLLIFAGCVMWWDLPVEFAAIIAAGVLVAGLLFGRRMVEFAMKLFAGFYTQNRE